MNGAYRSVAVLGAGAWGTALAQVAAAAGRDVTLWAREPEVVEGVNSAHENPLFLPGIALNAKVRATNSIEEAAKAELILAVPPAQHMRAVLRSLRPHLRSGAPLVLCAKGVERGSLALMTDVLAEEIPGVVPAVLSGPGFAKDVARGLPTATTIASPDPDLAQRIVATIGLPTFRPYFADDLIGAEIGGAVKNVIAIACGVAEGRKLGDGARAALITRGFAELTRLGLAMGAKAETLSGLCGLGDLVLTCASLTSRNTSLGAALGEGRKLKDILAERRSVAEGMESAPAVVALAAKYNVEMPICAAVDAIVGERIGIDEAITALLSRPFKAESA
ncbi:Glycerol-3-phosphate dehydrogenase [NAD(P)+] [Terricaulis silvestris]|uniref:Glycerol-3-phosphate dehydrogenase [NAD(P)+] n=1 Tax=Terricaulis silvestris TaxID=2686094 RepID=A0A6I6N0J3_9CAUL|nr:NAD(P)H-dependent glycerol-3-phosphate dehydrogenase [Terricaulis silvestris]QGZ96853.1 Glycerol-3-phosphate dehydrogenase [NAD(P)+] [Terricaulis silvestris]